MSKKNYIAGYMCFTDRGYETRLLCNFERTRWTAKTNEAMHITKEEAEEYLEMNSDLDMPACFVMVHPRSCAELDFGKENHESII